MEVSIILLTVPNLIRISFNEVPYICLHCINLDLRVASHC